MDRRSISTLTVALLLGAGFTARANALPIAPRSPSPDVAETKPNVAPTKPQLPDAETRDRTTSASDDKSASWNADLHRKNGLPHGKRKGKGKGHKQHDWPRGFTRGETSGTVETPGRPYGLSYSPTTPTTANDVSEPQSASLLILGVAGMIALRRRKVR
jgi:hypothetical protein